MNRPRADRSFRTATSRMKPDDDEFFRILKHVAPMSEGEKAETLLRYFSAAIRELNTPALQQFRAFCAACDEGTDAETTMLEIIDGQLALREIEQLE